MQAASRSGIHRGSVLGWPIDPSSLGVHANRNGASFLADHRSEELDACAHVQDFRYRVLEGMLIEGQDASVVGIDQPESLMTIQSRDGTRVHATSRYVVEK